MKIRLIVKQRTMDELKDRHTQLSFKYICFSCSNLGENFCYYPVRKEYTECNFKVCTKFGIGLLV